MKISYILKDKLNIIENELDNNLVRYSLFQGDILIEDNGNEIITDWGWVPLLDFTCSLVDIFKHLEENDNQTQEFEFTESNEKIFFNKNKNKIKIYSSFSNDEIIVDYYCFKKEVIINHFNLLNEILEKNPNLISNVIFLKYYNILLKFTRK